MHESFPSQLATWIGSPRNQALGWSTARRSTTTLCSSSFALAVAVGLQLHMTPHSTLGRKITAISHISVFPSQSYILTLQREIGNMPNKGTVNVLLDLKCSGVEGSMQQHRNYCAYSHGAVREKCVVTDLWHCYLTWKSAVCP